MLLLKAWSLRWKDHHNDYCLQLGLANKTFGGNKLFLEMFGVLS